MLIAASDPIISVMNAKAPLERRRIEGQRFCFLFLFFLCSSSFQVTRMILLNFFNFFQFIFFTEAVMQRLHGDIFSI